MTADQPVLDVGEMSLKGRVMPASNATFVATIGTIEVVYKPSRGERPLWDFPSHTLAQREVAAYLVSEATGWNLVPRTLLRDGPFGEGMVQEWQSIDPGQEAVRIVAEGEVPPGFLHVLDGFDAEDRAVALVHEDSPALRRIALFDVVTNNADRKGGHVLAMADGHRYGVDHGLTFHTEPKLRTVLWGWAGEPLTSNERAVVETLSRGLGEDLGDCLHALIDEAEVDALRERCARVLAVGEFPYPHGDGPAIPWPPF